MDSPLAFGVFGAYGVLGPMFVGASLIGNRSSTDSMKLLSCACDVHVQCQSLVPRSSATAKHGAVQSPAKLCCTTITLGLVISVCLVTALSLSWWFGCLV